MLGMVCCLLLFLPFFGWLGMVRLMNFLCIYEPASSSSRIAHPFPEEAALRCKAGTTALKGNVSEKAAQSFRHSLKLNPFLWEAFEGLCALGKRSLFYSF